MQMLSGQRGERSEAVSTEAFLFRDLEVKDEPYRFFTCSPFLQADLAQDLLAWLESGVAWSLAQTDFYQQFECRLYPSSSRNNQNKLLLPETLSYLRQRVGEFFSIQLSDRLTIVGHKLVNGQAIGVHNDDPEPGGETHRLVLQLNRNSGCHVGGELRIHNRNSPSDVFHVLQPLHNSAFGFEMSPYSFHSVTPADGWTRYTIIFSFWSKAAEIEAKRLKPESGDHPVSPTKRQTASSIVQGLDPSELANLGRLTEFLKILGAGGKEHSGRTLLEHLVHTYLILRSWDCSPELAAAGLFHSIYGTTGFTHSTLDPDDRGALAQVIGAKAEQLAYLFCACSRKSLFANVTRGEPFSLFDPRAQRHTSIDRETLCQLLTLDLANSVEQLTHLTEISDALASDRELYTRAVSFLPKLAADAMLTFYGLGT